MLHDETSSNFTDLFFAAPFATRDVPRLPVRLGVFPYAAIQTAIAGEYVPHQSTDGGLNQW